MYGTDRFWQLPENNPEKGLDVSLGQFTRKFYPDGELNHSELWYLFRCEPWPTATHSDIHGMIDNYLVRYRNRIGILCLDVCYFDFNFPKGRNASACLMPVLSYPFVISKRYGIGQPLKVFGSGSGFPILAFEAVGFLILSSITSSWDAQI